MIRVGINGFGRIGRQVFRAILERCPGTVSVVAVNDLYDVATNAHLLSFDTNYGRFPGTVRVRKDGFSVNGHPVRNFAFRDPGQIPWDDAGVDVVIESTGLFTEASKAAAHIEAGVKKVIISAPAKGEDLTVVMGVNHRLYRPEKHHILSNASCTTNCLAPPVMVLHRRFGIERGMMTTVHSYTNDQRILDMPHRDLRRARAAGQNIIPTTTGAARALSLVLPELEGRFDGYSLRVPTPTVSVVDFTAELRSETTTDELRQVLRGAARNSLKGILGFADIPLVSSDFKGDSRSSIVDLEFTQVLRKNWAKVVTWYDNEWGYSCRVADLVEYIGGRGL
ncbi:MAG: type I glyceraldehyde-3-phosphate dehydrogenase [Deltaproteobacteria bacterium HGW-Deltaproteobacteria-19]|jgi:glyceraldehyde 3-phosphate dehydrogenase|nr:MAG: type I glyceraldehyde-3-phosphate dehydrogenase [Deltaproteobacteria bacterium HGW-Deltaproteobacteria-19]